MINHARTLLINQPGSYVVNVLGEEIIDPAYSPVTLPSFMQRIYNLLFGANPDRLMLNYRSRQYLALIHSTELVKYVTDLDPRITYDLEDETFFDSSLYVPEVTKIQGPPTSQIWLLGNDNSPDPLGRMNKTWSIYVDSSVTLKITTHNPYKVLNVAYQTDGGISNIISLPSSNLSIRINSSSVGARWRVSSVTRPSVDLGEIAAELETSNDVTRLFYPAEKKGFEEPWVTFSGLWYDHYAIPYKLGGLLLAYIYRTEELIHV